MDRSVHKEMTERAVQKNAALVRAAQSGDRKAIDKLLSSQQALLRAYGMQVCRNADDASDVTQDAMLAIARGIGSFRGDASLSTWMFQIARRCCMRKRRRHAGEPSHFAGVDGATLVDPGHGPELWAEHHELQEGVRAALATLSPAARDVLLLRDGQGLTAAESARVLGISEHAVKSRLHRARAAFAIAVAGRAGS